jgi:hypothetical protein
MASRWLRVSELAACVALQKRLSDLAESPVVDAKGALVLEELVGSSLGDPNPDDITGYEAVTNKIHVSDYVDSACHEDELVVQGVKYAERLIARLAGTGRPVTIILSRDPDSDEVTVRFFTRREGQPWGAKDVEDYKLDEVVQWDVE